MPTDLPERLFANTTWHALQTKHRHFAISNGEACRYPADVAPMAAVASPSEGALRQMASLLVPGESVWLPGESFPKVGELLVSETMPCLQMVLPEEVTLPAPAIGIERISCAQADEMVALTTLAFPGFFRSRTCAMGSYFGVRSDGELIAMGGERLMLDGYSEISGVCTHPAHRGRGHAASLIWQVVREQRREGVVSWLHVGSANRHAIELYLWMGFEVVREITIHRISLTGGIAI